VGEVIIFPENIDFDKLIREAQEMVERSKGYSQSDITPEMYSCLMETNLHYVKMVSALMKMLEKSNKNNEKLLGFIEGIIGKGRQ